MNKNGTVTGKAEANIGTRGWSGGGKAQSGSTSVSGGRNKSTTADADMAAAYQQYYQAQAERERQLAAMRQAMAQRAYEQNMAALHSAYGQRAGLLGENLQTTMNDLQRGYDRAQNRVNGNTDRALQEAYVNMMMNRRDLPQLLAAQGMTGGMSEGTLAGIRSSYGGERNRLERSRGDALGELLDTLLSGQSEARQSYNSQVSDDSLRKTNAMMQLEQALVSGVAESLADQYKNLGSLDSAYLQQMAKLGQNANLNFSALAGASEGLAALNAPRKTDVAAAGAALQNGTATAAQLKALLEGEEVSEGSAIVTLMNAGLSEEAARALVAKSRYA